MPAEASDRFEELGFGASWTGQVMMTASRTKSLAACWALLSVLTLPQLLCSGPDSSAPRSLQTRATMDERGWVILEGGLGMEGLPTTILFDGEVFFAFQVQP
jgi:hypothetical protein